MENKENIKAEDSKEVSSRDLLCGKKKDVKFPENINDDLIIGTYVISKNVNYGVYVRLDKEKQSWKKFFEAIGVHAFLPASITSIVRHGKIIPGNPFPVDRT
jgi:hypothetical protein